MCLLAYYTLSKLVSKLQFKMKIRFIFRYEEIITKNWTNIFERTETALNNHFGWIKCFCYLLKQQLELYSTKRQDI